MNHEFWADPMIGELLTDLIFWKSTSFLFCMAFAIVALVALVQSVYIAKYKKDHWWRG